MPDFKKHISDFILKSDFIGCLVLDRESNMLFTNQVFDNTMLGIEGSAKGMNLIEVLCAEEKESVRRIVDRLFEQGSIPKTEWEIVNNANEKGWIYHQRITLKIQDQKACFPGLCMIGPIVHFL